MAEQPEFDWLADMIAKLDEYVDVLSANGFSITAHFLEIAVLDLKCRASGVSEHEIVTLGLLARHVFERKWAARRVSNCTPGNET
jgi:hypothetical protein